MAAVYPRYSYIISRIGDPLFALFIGTSAATLRIRREEIEKGHSGSLGETLGLGWRRGRGYFNTTWGIAEGGAPETANDDLDVLQDYRMQRLLLERENQKRGVEREEEGSRG